MGTLYKRLKIYGSSDYYGFHMPGHKRNKRFEEDIPACGIDITEIEGFDDLHHAKGILKEAQIRAAAVYGADETHFLVNGSTVGILSGILGATNKGDRILVARNCHKSVYHAIYMNELKPVYLYPGFDRDSQLNLEVSVQEVREALEAYSDIRAVVIVSPTYDGVVSDISKVAAAVHEKGLPLIVDEAHGAHFGFHPYFPKNANACGADIVIHSVHKTLPSLTQTALLHINGELVNRRRIRRYLHMLQSSSPSYVLMAGIDSCIHLLETKREELFSPYVELLRTSRNALKGLKQIKLAEAEKFDYSKIILSVKNSGIDGKELYRMLFERYHLQMEMMAGTYVLAMTSPGDSPEGFGRLVKAVSELDRELCAEQGAGKSEGCHVLLPEPIKLTAAYSSAEIDKIIMKREAEGVCSGRKRFRVTQKESEGYVALEYAYLYPPGIPLIVPGEKITREAAELLERYRQAGYQIEGTEEEGKIEVWG